MQNEEKIKKLKTFAQHPEMAMWDEQQAIAESLSQIAENTKPSTSETQKVSLEGIEVVTLKGEKGEKGDQGDKGEQGESGIDGTDGKDGLNGTDGKNGLDGQNGIDGRDGEDGLDGLDGKDGKDGSPDTPTQIKDKLETLKGKKRLNISAIDGVETFQATVVEHATTQARGLLYAGLLENNTTTNKNSGIEFVVDGGGSALSTGIKGDLKIPFNCTVTEWALLADQSGSIVMDVWKDTQANFPPLVGDSITGSDIPTLSSQTNASSTALTGWTTAITAGDILRFNINSISTITRITIALKVTKN